LFEETVSAPFEESWGVLRCSILTDDHVLKVKPTHMIVSNLSWRLLAVPTADIRPARSHTSLSIPRCSSTSHPATQMIWSQRKRNEFPHGTASSVPRCGVPSKLCLKSNTVKGFTKDRSFVTSSLLGIFRVLASTVMVWED
jgi:hypothetical protein